MLSDSVRRYGLAARNTVAVALIFLCLLLGLALAPRAQAAATTYCVNTPTCSGTTVGSIGAAITAAAGNAGDDRIEIGSGLYSDGPWSVGAGNSVRIVGVGATKPVLTGDLTIAQSVLTIGAGGSTIDNIAIAIPSLSVAKVGLTINANTVGNGVSVTGAGSVGATGVVISGNNASRLENCDISLPWGAGNDSMAVWLNTAGSTQIYASSFAAAAGVQAIDSNALDLQRLKVLANRGVEFRNSSGTVSSSLLRYSSPLNIGYVYGIRMNNLSGGSFTVYSVNNTILGHGSPGAGLVSSLSLLGGTNTWWINSNLIQGWAASLTNETLAGTTAMNINYSRYDVVPSLGVQTGNALLAGDPGFVNAIAGDFALQRDSVLVDAGDPNPVAASPQPSGRDLAGNDRQVNAIGAGTAERDIGAYEVQNATPIASLAVVTADPQTGYPVSFSAAGSSEPDGDALTYLWTFDDGTTSAGPTADRLWQVAGIQTVQLKVTDSTGLSHSTAVQLDLKKGTAAVKLPKTTSKISRQGSFPYRLSCPQIATGSCTGRLTFKTAAKVDVKRYGANTLRANKKIVKAGQYVFTLKPGQTKTLRVRTYRTFIKLLKKQRKVLLRATLSGSADNVNLTAEPADFNVKR